MFTGLNVVGHADTLEEAERVFNDKREACAGLLMVIDCEAGEAADMGYNRKGRSYIRSYHIEKL